MIDERLTDAERRRLIHLAMAAMPLGNSDKQLLRILAKISGTDTVLIARRAYPSATRD